MKRLFADLMLLLFVPVSSCGTTAPHSDFTRASVISGSAKVLRTWDKNADGRLSQSEVTAIVDQFIRLQQPHLPKSSTSDKSAKERSQLIADFTEQDSNHDGYLTLGELVSKPLASFDCADLNHDGELSAYEMSSETVRCASK